MLKDSFISAFKHTRLHKLRYLLRNKYDAELDFQKNWNPIFLANPKATLDYWNEHLCLQTIKRVCNITDSTKILGVGCSPSTVLQFIDGKKYAIDPLADEYKKFLLTHNFGEINLRKGYGEFIPFADDSFDVVFCTNVLDHTSNPEKVISEIFRVLNSSGRLVLVVEVFSVCGVRDVAHPSCFTVGAVQSLLERFEVVFNRVVAWNPHGFYFKARDNFKTDLVLVAKKLIGAETRNGDNEN